MNALARLLFRAVREDNPLIPGDNTTLAYSKPVEEWSIEERDKWDGLVIKEPIKGLERRVMSTIIPERGADFNEVSSTAQKELKELYFKNNFKL